MCFYAYPFPIFPEEWDESMPVTDAWDNKGDIVIGNDVWIGYEAVIMAGVHIGDGAIIGTRAVVTKDVPPYTIVGGIPAKKIRSCFDSATIELLQQLQWWDWDTANEIALQQSIYKFHHMCFNIFSSFVLTIFNFLEGDICRACSAAFFVKF